MEPAAFGNYLGQKLAAESRHAVANETEDGPTDIPTDKPSPSDATGGVAPVRSASGNGAPSGAAAMPGQAGPQSAELAASASPMSRRGLRAGMNTLRAALSSNLNLLPSGLSSPAPAATGEGSSAKAFQPVPEERWKGYFKRDIPVGAYRMPRRNPPCAQSRRPIRIYGSVLSNPRNALHPPPRHHSSRCVSRRKLAGLRDAGGRFRVRVAP